MNINDEDELILESTLFTSSEVLTADGRDAEAGFLWHLVESYGALSSHERIESLKDLRVLLRSLVGKIELPNVSKCIEFLKGVQNRLQGYGERHASPEIKNPIEILKSLQEHHKELEADHFEKQVELEADLGNITKELGDEGFWLNLLKTDKILAQEITTHDETTLSYLKEIKCCSIDNSGGFRLEFYFNPMPDNPEHSLLTKTFHIDGTILKNSIGTNVEGPQRCPSFFNFFRDTEDENAVSYCFVIDLDQAEEIPSKMERDYDIGSRIRDKIIYWCEDFEEDSEEDSTDDSKEDAEEDPRKEILIRYRKMLQCRNSYCFRMNRLDKLNKRFEVKRDELEAEYQKRYEPLYRRRYRIVNGITADDVNNEVAVDREDKTTQDKRVPCFWLNAMKANKQLAQEITTRDEGPLTYLTDIMSWVEVKCSMKIFRLVFVFGCNPYFENSMLHKTYDMFDSNWPRLENRYGTEIKWHPGKRLTEEVPEMESITDQLLAKTADQRSPSFFNFFDPPEYYYASYLNDRNAQKVEDHLKRDYHIGAIIRDEIIPDAVLWYNGDLKED